jgi:hypothetical protein
MSSEFSSSERNAIVFAKILIETLRGSEHEQFGYK